MIVAVEDAPGFVKAEGWITRAFDFSSVLCQFSFALLDEVAWVSVFFVGNNDIDQIFSEVPRESADVLWLGAFPFTEDEDATL